MDSGIELPIGHGKPPVSEYSLPRDGGGAASVEEQEAPTEVQETAELSVDRTGQRLVSTQTVQHDYLTLGGRVTLQEAVCGQLTVVQLSIPCLATFHIQMMEDGLSPEERTL